MNITRSLSLGLIGAVLLAGLTTPLRAQTSKPAKTTGTDPATTLTEDDRSDTKTATGDSTATGETTTQPAGGPAKKTPSFFDNHMLMMMIGVMLLMFIFMGRGKRKREAQRKTMLAALKKGDKVTTIGGIIGTVMEVRDDEVVVKIDESSNARMRFARWAVRGIGDQAKTDDPEDKK